MSFLISDGVIVMSDDMDIFVSAHEEHSLREFESEFNVELDRL